MPVSLETRVEHLEREASLLREAFAAFQSRTEQFLKRYVASCPACRGVFDMLANHYSIGLFDNLVYVKCPHCNKSMPIIDKKDGGIDLVAG